MFQHHRRCKYSSCLDMYLGLHHFHGIRLRGMHPEHDMPGRDTVLTLRPRTLTCIGIKKQYHGLQYNIRQSHLIQYNVLLPSIL